MKPRGFTPVANAFFDKYMCELSPSAIRVYLKITRNTRGWRDANGNVKGRDWISHSQFSDVGVSSRSVTNAIEELLAHNLINLTDEYGQSINNAKKRKIAKRIYYSLTDTTKAINASHKANFDQSQSKNCDPQKEIYKKKYNANERIPDHIRLQQILDEEAKKQMKRDSWL